MTSEARRERAGRPAHKPTDDTRKLCLTLSGYGVPQVEIAKQIGIHDETLRIHYREELDSGVAQANAKVAESLYRKAIGDGTQSASSAMFWLKTRAGWKETVVNDHTSSDGSMTPKGGLDASKLSSEALAEIVALSDVDEETVTKSE